MQFFRLHQARCRFKGKYNDLQKVLNPKKIPNKIKFGTLYVDITSLSTQFTEKQIK